MLNWAFGSKRDDGTAPPAPPYDEAKRITESGSTEERTQLASCGDVPPEFLYYFATEGAPDVKAAVAKNQSTPLQADMVLSKDDDDSVREILAGKIGEKAAFAEPDKDPKSTGMVHQILDTLARDQLPAVRGIISDAIRSLDNVPKPIVSLLASDVDELVSSPILQFSPLLSDAELANMVGEGMGTTAMKAVASRDNLGSDVTSAVTATGDTAAIETMLHNATASIGNETFDQIAALAENAENLHAPMVGRADLPPEAAKKIATFISDALLDQLSSRNDLDESVKEELRSKIETRLGGAQAGPKAIDLNNAQSISEAYAEAKKGRIGAHKVMRSLNRGNYSYVVAAMALMAGVTHEQLVKAVLASDTRKLISVAWKCGFDPFMAETIQKKLPPIKDSDVLAPDSNGRFPIAPTDMDSVLNSMQT